MKKSTDRRLLFSVFGPVLHEGETELELKPIKASDLKQGDVIVVDKFSGLYLEKVPTPCTVLNVAVNTGGSFNISAKAKQLAKEFMTTIYARPDTVFDAI